MQLAARRTHNRRDLDLGDDARAPRGARDERESTFFIFGFGTEEGEKESDGYYNRE